MLISQVIRDVRDVVVGCTNSFSRIATLTRNNKAYRFYRSLQIALDHAHASYHGERVNASGSRLSILSRSRAIGAAERRPDAGRKKEVNERKGEREIEIKRRSSQGRRKKAKTSPYKDERP